MYTLHSQNLAISLANADDQDKIIFSCVVFNLYTARAGITLFCYGNFITIFDEVQITLQSTKKNLPTYKI